MTIPVSKNSRGPTYIPQLVRGGSRAEAGRCPDFAPAATRFAVACPVTRWIDTAVEAATEWPVRGTEASHELAKVSALVADLLASANKVLDSDHDTALQCIAHAAAVVEKIGRRPPADERGVHKGGLTLWQTRQLKAHIDANLADRITLDGLSEVARLSTSHFSRAFKRSFGMAPFAFIQLRRMEHAQQLMLTTELPLCQIALECGLSDQSHFSRLFRRATGTSPNAWRRLHRLGEPTLVASD